MTKSKFAPFVKPQKTNLTRVNLPSLDQLIEQSILNFSTQLSGEYDFYCVYEKKLEHSFERYALIYAFYPESTPFHDSPVVHQSSMEQLSYDDSWKLFNHFKLLNIPLDYIFVVPYFDRYVKPRDSYTFPAVITSKSLSVLMD